MTILLLILGLILLLTGGTALVRGASGLAARYGISPLVVGLTVVAFGTSAPELIVNVIGAIRGETELAFGNVAGSNIANLGLVLGSAALIRPISIEGQIVRRELPLLLLGTTILLVMTMDVALANSAPILNRSDALILLLLFGVFAYITISDFLAQRDDALIQNLEEFQVPVAGDTEPHAYLIGGGIVALATGGQLTIIYGAELATILGLPPVVIGLLFVAIGTSLPELVTSIIAATKGESDLCVGNVVGSNIFNGLVVLPISALIRPLPVPEGGIADVFMGLVFAAVIIPMFYYGKGRMNRVLGVAFLAAYFVYMFQRVSG